MAGDDTHRRTVGRRLAPDLALRARTAAGPTPEEIEWIRAMSNYRTRVPKGVFRYRSHAEANADWERWHAELVAATARRRGSGAATASAETRAGGESEQATHNPAFTRPARWEDVLATTRLLNAAGVEYALVGGYALAAHGHVRMTQDIDIAVAVDPANTRRWIQALGALPDGVSLELAGEAGPFEGDHLHGIRLNDEFTVDILPSVAGIPFAELVPHIVRLDLGGEQVPVLDLEGLLKTKQALRPKDQAHAAVLRRALEALRRPR
jgi:hypothetical protein